jgi:hypothetical protein
LEEAYMSGKSHVQSRLLAVLIGVIVLLSSASFVGIASRSGHDVAVMLITDPEGTNGTFYMRPGTIHISCLIENLGAYDESNLTCTAVITIQNSTFYSETVSGIDLGIGEMESVVFVDATLYFEGEFLLSISLPLDSDSDPSNNVMTLIIIVDGTPPVYELWLDPPVPNGNQGWYVTPVTFGFNITGDGWVYYSLDGSPWIQYTEPVIINTSGIHTIAYYATDATNNTTPTYDFSIYIDFELPTYVLSKQIWLNRIKFTATVNDTISGINRVEFYLFHENGNATLLYNDTSGYDGYSYTLHPIPRCRNCTLNAYVFDQAGNSVISWTCPLPPANQHPVLQLIKTILSRLFPHHALL